MWGDIGKFILGLAILSVLAYVLKEVMDPLNTSVIAIIPNVADWELAMWAMWPILFVIGFFVWLVVKYLAGRDKEQGN